MHFGQCYFILSVNPSSEHQNAAGKSLWYHSKCYSYTWQPTADMLSMSNGNTTATGKWYYRLCQEGTACMAQTSVAKILGLQVKAYYGAFCQDRGGLLW